MLLVGKCAAASASSSFSRLCSRLLKDSRFDQLAWAWGCNTIRPAACCSHAAFLMPCTALRKRCPNLIRLLGPAAKCELPGHPSNHGWIVS